MTKDEQGILVEAQRLASPGGQAVARRFREINGSNALFMREGKL